ncbi:SMP-30/gluconolactonase/LRE family protein [Lysinibacillus sp. NPDC097231]|uniref:SMP-30/gluconolactonase/LRE family protein n=1 Tax=Lysinibacillus sp. NPDC097231 TaxID=3364142 RepID=UPI003828D979
MQFSKKSCFIVLLCFCINFSTLFPSLLVEASGGEQFTTFLPKDPQAYFNSPQGVAVDKDGNMYVADSENQRIQKFTSDGTFQKTWGSSGASDGQFQYPTGIAVDAAGNVYVADYYSHRIQKFTSDGTFQKHGEVMAQVTVSFDIRLELRWMLQGMCM